MTDLIEIFEIQKTCEYRGEIYHVRDNGAVYRCGKPGKRKRPLDNKWIFGTPDKQKGYFNISSETVHRIVATAFLGPQPTEKHIVDHIDTNKKNNRPENLRWVTRLENIMLNEVSLSRILYKYGSIDYFLSNPSKPINGVLEQNFEWMRTVTKEESETTKDNLLNWAKEGRIPTGGTLGEWVYSKLDENSQISEDEPLIQSLTPGAFQKSWKTPTEFPNCPDSAENDAIALYWHNLISGSIFSKNQYGESIVEDSVVKDNELFILTRNDGIKPYALAKVYIEENYFVHESVRTFFSSNGAQKQFALAQGKTWEGEDSIDDYS